MVRMTIQFRGICKGKLIVRPLNVKQKKKKKINLLEITYMYGVTYFF